MACLLQSSYSALAPVLGSFYNFKSLSLQMSLPKLQEEKGSVSEGGEHTWEADAKQLLCVWFGFFFFFALNYCEVPRCTNPYPTAECKTNTK